MVNQNCNYWEFQVHWNKHEWVNPRIRIEQNNPCCASSKNICLKDNNKTAYWVGHLKLKTLDAEYFFQRKNLINDIQAS